MRLLIVLCLLILIVCLFYFPLEGFQSLVDGSNTLAHITLAESIGDTIKSMYPQYNFRMKPIEHIDTKDTNT